MGVGVECPTITIKTKHNRKLILYDDSQYFLQVDDVFFAPLFMLIFRIMYLLSVHKGQEPVSQTTSCNVFSQKLTNQKFKNGN